MMQVLSAERSFEPCTESGWYGYDIRIDAPINAQLIEVLGVLGRMSCILTLKRPFFIVRGDGFLLRGITGDCFLRAGFAEKSAPQMDLILAVISSTTSAE
jgi:hypothetical protein